MGKRDSSYNYKFGGFFLACLAVVTSCLVVILSGYASLFAATTPKIACGAYHTIALKSDGTVWAWGANQAGQLGDGTHIDNTDIIHAGIPVQVSSLSGVTAIAGGRDHTAALKSDGTVWAWGYNYYGQLGDGTTTNSYTPVQVSSLSGVTAIAGGYYHTIALKSDGTVWTWGNNDIGQLGDGTTNNRLTPVQVSGLSGVTAIAGGYSHTIALKSGGTVWAWGYNKDGQLGNVTIKNWSTPVQAIINLGVATSTTPTPSPTPTECTATAIIASAKAITIKKLKQSSVTITVTGNGDCKVKGEKVTARVDASGKKMVSVTPASAKTGEDGSATFKLKAKFKTGITKVTFSTANGVSSSVEVTITN